MSYNILIAVDHSEHAIKAANFGYELAHKLNAKVTILHVIDDYRVSLLKRHSSEPTETIISKLNKYIMGKEE